MGLTHYALVVSSISKLYMMKCSCMSSSDTKLKFENHKLPEGTKNTGRVKLTDLVSRLNEEKKREKNSNIALSVAAISAVAVFGIILSI